MKIRCIIVDDEPHARRYLTELLSLHAEIELLESFKNGKELLDFSKTKSVDVIFLDIHMPGIDGMSLAKLVKDPDTLIVFTTAYDHHAAEAFEIEAFDYLLKPFDEHRFGQVLERIRDRMGKNMQLELNEKVQDLFNDFKSKKGSHLTRIELKEKGLVKNIRVKDILCFEASSVYVQIHTLSEKVLYRISLNLLEQQLSPTDFIRIHRSYIVNKTKVEKIKYLNNSTFEITLKSSMKVISSRGYYTQISRAFN